MNVKRNNIINNTIMCGTKWNNTIWIWKKKRLAHKKTGNALKRMNVTREREGVRERGEKHGNRTTIFEMLLCTHIERAFNVHVLLSPLRLSPSRNTKNTHTLTEQQQHSHIEKKTHILYGHTIADVDLKIRLKIWPSKFGQYNTYNALLYVY